MSIKIERYDLPNEAAIKEFFRQHFLRWPGVMNFPERFLAERLPAIRRAVVITSPEYDAEAVVQELLKEMSPNFWQHLLEISFDDESPKAGEAFSLLREKLGQSVDDYPFTGVGHRDCRELTVTYFGR